MHRRTTLPPSLVRLMATQHGVVSRQQAEGMGVPPSAVTRLVRSGVWHPLARGVFSDSPRPDFTAVLWGGTLYGGPASCVSGVAALALSGLLEEPDPPHLIVGRAPSTPLWDVRRLDRTGRGLLPRTPIEQALLDAWPQLAPAEFVIVVGRAATRRMTSPSRVLDAAGMRSRIPRRRELLELLADADEGARSPLEVDYLRKVERAHGLPAGRRQSAIGTGHTADVEYLEWGVVVELDGRTYHEDVFRDMSRDNALLLTGRVTLRYGAMELRADPCGIARQVAAVLASRGWRGSHRRCARCG